MPTTASIRITGKVQFTQKEPLDVWFRKVQLTLEESIGVEEKLNSIKNTVLSSLKRYIKSHRKRPAITKNTKERNRLTPEDNLYNVIALNSSVYVS